MDCFVISIFVHILFGCYKSYQSKTNLSVLYLHLLLCWLDSDSINSCVFIKASITPLISLDQHPCFYLADHSLNPLY